MSATGFSGGGAFNPAADFTLSGTITLASGGSITVASGATLATASGATATSSGAVLATPTITFNPVQVTATGATGSAAASLGSAYPAVCSCTGASGAGVNLPTGACVPGAVYVIKNKMTGALAVYSVGATINGTTGTTAYSVTATGNLTALAYCVNAGAWEVQFNT
jgi:hypothetical protein